MGNIGVCKTLKTNYGRIPEKMMFIVISGKGTEVEWGSNQRENSLCLYCLNVLIVKCVNKH